MKIILQKYIASAGYCSRRQAEQLIRNKRVKVNGGIAELGQAADNNDQIEIDGKRLKADQEKIYIKLNKPAGYVCTNRKFPGEKNIFDLVDIDEKLFVVGRLDKESHGLIILTNDGDWAQTIMHPRYEHEKQYLARIKSHEAKFMSGLFFDLEKKFIAGIDIGEGDGIAKAKKMKYIDNDSFEIILTEGKKRQIRRMFRAVSLEVIDLKRIRIGKIELGGLKSGEWENFKI